MEPPASEPTPAPALAPGSKSPSNIKVVITAVVITAVVTSIIAVAIFCLYQKRRPAKKKEKDSIFNSTYDNPLLNSGIRSHFWKFQGDAYAPSESGVMPNIVPGWPTSPAQKQDITEAHDSKEEVHKKLGSMEWIGPAGFRSNSAPPSFKKAQELSSIGSVTDETDTRASAIAGPASLSISQPPKAAVAASLRPTSKFENGKRPGRDATKDADESLDLSTSSIVGDFGQGFLLSNLDTSYSDRWPTNLDTSYSDRWPTGSSDLQQAMPVTDNLSVSVNTETSGASAVGSCPISVSTGTGVSSSAAIGHSLYGQPSNQLLSLSASMKETAPGLRPHTEKLPGESCIPGQSSINPLNLQNSLSLLSFPDTSSAVANEVLNSKRSSNTAGPGVLSSFISTKIAELHRPSNASVTGFTSTDGVSNQSFDPLTTNDTTGDSGKPDPLNSEQCFPSKRSNAAPPAVFSFTTQPVPPLPLPPALVSAAIVKARQKSPSSEILPPIPVKSVAAAFTSQASHTSTAPLQSSLQGQKLKAPTLSSLNNDTVSESFAATSFPKGPTNEIVTGETSGTSTSSLELSNGSSAVFLHKVETEKQLMSTIPSIPSTKGAPAPSVFPPLTAEDFCVAKPAPSSLPSPPLPLPPSLTTSSPSVNESLASPSLPKVSQLRQSPSPTPPPPPPPPPPPLQVSPLLPLQDKKSPPFPPPPPLLPPNAKASILPVASVGTTDSSTKVVPPPPPPLPPLVPPLAPGAKGPPPPPPPPRPGAKVPPAPPPPRGPPAPPGPAPRASSNSKPPQGPQVDAAQNVLKLKPLHWDKVRADPSRSMVWDRLKSGSFQLNEDEIASLFGVNATTTVKQIGKSSLISKPKGILDAKKAHHMAIQLRALNISSQDICDALLEGDGLSSELLDVLVKMCPTQEEQKSLLDFSGDKSELGPAERFLKSVLQIPNAFQRLEAMRFKAFFKDDLEQVEDAVQILEAACRQVKESRLFLKLLEAVLKTGNHMNKGTNRGEATAFKLDALLKLSDVKSADGKTTLLHFVVEEIIKAEGIRALSAHNEASSDNKGDPNIPSSPVQKSEIELKRMGLEVVLGLCTELDIVKKAAGIDADTLNQSMLRLAGGLSSIQGRLKTNFQMQAESSGMFDTEDTFSMKIEEFCSAAEGDVIRSKQELGAVFDKVKQVTAYFHGNLRETQPLRLFMIVRDFLFMLQKVCQDLEKSLKVKRRG